MALPAPMLNGRGAGRGDKIAEAAAVTARVRSYRSADGRPAVDAGVRAIPLEEHTVGRAKAGDGEAVAQLYERHATRVYQYFLARLQGRTQQAEDLTSEVFVRAIEGLDGYECRGLPFAAWLFRIAHNLLVDYIRRQPRDPFLALDACEDLPAPAGQRELDRVTDRADLVRAIRRLTREQQAVLELRFIQGWSIAGTAAVLGKTEEAVKKLQARGLMTLQRALLGPEAAPPPASKPPAVRHPGRRVSSRRATPHPLGGDSSVTANGGGAAVCGVGAPIVAGTAERAEVGTYGGDA